MKLVSKKVSELKEGQKLELDTNYKAFIKTIFELKNDDIFTDLETICKHQSKTTALFRSFASVMSGHDLTDSSTELLKSVGCSDDDISNEYLNSELEFKTYYNDLYAIKGDAEYDKYGSFEDRITSHLILEYTKIPDIYNRIFPENTKNDRVLLTNERLKHLDFTLKLENEEILKPLKHTRAVMHNLHNHTELDSASKLYVFKDSRKTP